MNVILWAIQIAVAVFCVMGAGWRFVNYDQAAKGVPSVQALGRGVWNVIGVFEILAALALILPGLLGMWSGLTGLAATALAIEMLALTLWHGRFFGAKLAATNPAVWTLVLAVLSAVIAWQR